MQLHATSPQRQLVPAQSPFVRQPATQRERVRSQTSPSVHCRSDEQRPRERHWPLEVSQNVVVSRQSELFSQPDRSWQKPAMLQN